MNQILLTCVSPSRQIEMKLLQESTGKMRELERLGLALDKKGKGAWHVKGWGKTRTGSRDKKYSVYCVHVFIETEPFR